MEIHWHRRARNELDDAAEYYENARAGLGEEFLSEVDRSLDLIRTSPNAWPAVTPKSQRVRTKRFPYGIVYQRVAEGLLIVAVMHLRRRPGYWHDRER